MECNKNVINTLFYTRRAKNRAIGVLQLHQGEKTTTKFYPHLKLASFCTSWLLANHNTKK